MPTETPEQLMARGIDERERLRFQRVTNYAVKRNNGFKCSECDVDTSILVVRDEHGLTTRCSKHIGDLEPTPGQHRGAA